MNDKSLDIPVTTSLAGLTSVSDLLNELPLSDTLTSQSANKSLLFHPRVAEEASNVLNQRDDALAQQLINAIQQTDSSYIDIKSEYLKEETNAEAPLLLKLIESSRPSVFSGGSSSNMYNNQQKYVNPIASSHFQNAPQQNITQNYSLHPNNTSNNNVNAQEMQMSSHYDASSSFNSNNINFNNFDPSNQFQSYQSTSSQYQQQNSSQNYEVGTMHQSQQIYQAQQQQPQQFYGQSSSSSSMIGVSHQQGLNNGPSSTYQHTINDLLVQNSTPTYQQQQPQSLYNNQVQSNQSSYNIEQLLDTSNSNQQQNLNSDYYPNNLQQQESQMTSSVCTSTTQNSSSIFSVDQSQVEQAAKIDQNHHYNHQQQHQQSQAHKPDQQIPHAITKNNHVSLPQQSPYNQTQQQQQQQQPQQIFNNVHHSTRSKSHQQQHNDSNNQKTVPRNNEYLEQQQQQRPSPAQGATAPDCTNHLNSVQKNDENAKQTINSINSTISVSEAATTSQSNKLQRENEVKPALMETYDISDADTVFNLKPLTINVSKIKMSVEEQQNAMATLEDLSALDLFSKMKEDEKLTTPNKRKFPFTKEEVEQEETFNQPKLRRIEKKLAPVITKMSTEELMKTNTYIRFNSFMEKIFEHLDDTEMMNYDENDENQECISPSLLANISAEAAKLKARASIDAIPEDKLTILINYAMRSVHCAKNFSAGPDLADDLVADDCLEKILNAIEAALLICNIYTSKDTKFLQEDNIDAIIKFVQFQLRETIFPSYDPVYTIETKKKTEKPQNKKKQNNQQKGITTLYTKIVELSKLFVRLFNKFHFVDTIIIHASALGVEPFFVDNIETLQFVCLDLVTSIFQNEKYKHHRHNILNDILSSVDRLPHSKRNLRPYKLMNNGGSIQMMTALVLQLIQCSVLLPDEIYEDERVSRKKNSESKTKIDADAFMMEKYKTATSIGGNFIQTFLNKCKSRSTETDFRPLFENFIHDLLTTVNKPEWPASELLLTLLGTVLVKYMSDKSVDQSIRVVSLEYLGLVAARLRKDTVKSRNRVKTMDELIKCIKIEQEKDGEDDSDNETMIEIDPEEERSEFLQRILLDYLLLNSQEENPVWNHARHFYLTLWYYDFHRRKKEIADGAKGYANRKKKSKNSRKRKDSDSDESSDSDVQEVREIDPELNREIFKVLDQRKKYLLSKVAPFKKTTRDIVDLKTYLDYDNANLIAQYLASKRRFSQSFDIYLKKIILVVREPVVAIRTRAMKCLGNIVEVDQSILARKDMQLGVSQKLLDAAISVREAAVDLVGKYILTDVTLVDQYYDMISPRILDTGVSVRKRVIKILRDICSEFPAHPKIPDICIKMLRRVNDEENIQKLVMEVFMTMWFTPCNNNDKSAIRRKCDQIIDVELSSQEKAFHGLLKTVFEPKEMKDDNKGKKEISPVLIRSCQQIVNGLVNLVMEYEKSNMGRLVGCMTALHSFAQIRPQLIIEHAITLEPYLNIKCSSNEQIKFISLLAEILEQVVPLMEHPGFQFLAELESHLMALIVTSRQIVVHSCVACLGAVINKLTKNYPLVRDCFQKIYNRALLQTKERLLRNSNLPAEQIYTPVFRRGIFTVGLLMRFFDFSQTEVNGSKTNERNRLSPTICDEIFETLFYFLNSNIQPIQREILQALGYFCVTNCEYLTRTELKEYYNHLLSNLSDQNELKIMVLKNILLYLMEEELKMTRNDKDWQTQSKTEDLKEMGDLTSGMSSRVIQIYLKEILNSFLNRDFNVRVMGMRVVEIVLRQGLVHPVQIVPYLICLSTDPETEAAHSADRHLQEIDKQYQGFVNMKCQQGILLSYQLQNVLQQQVNGRATRGYRMPKAGTDEPPTALNGFVYSLLRGTRPNRRALVASMTKQFDDERSTLSFMLYLADNLAYFPYAVQDEPLYLIHQIDLFISVTGTNLLQTFREGLIKKQENKEKNDNPLEDEDDEEDRDAIVEKLPENTTDLQQCITSAQGCMLLLILKQHLKDMYGINDAKIAQYSPSEASKVYDKALQRRNIQPFNSKATIAILKEDTKVGAILNDSEKRILVERYLEFKQLMIKLDPEDEAEDDDDENKHKQNMTPQKHPIQAVNQSGNSNFVVPDEAMLLNNAVMNNVQINLTRVNLPPEFQSYEKSINVNSLPKPSQQQQQQQKPSKPKSTPGKKSSNSTKKKRRKLSSSEEDEESDYDDDYE